MRYSKETVETVKRLMEAGYTQEQIEEKTGVSVREQRYWKRKGLLADISFLDERKRLEFQIKQLEDKIEKLEHKLRELGVPLKGQQKRLQDKQRRLQNQIRQLREEQKQLVDQLKRLMAFKKQEDKHVWTDISAADLLKNRFEPRAVPPIIASLGIAKQQNNIRAHRYLKRLIELTDKYPQMPEAWSGVIAGFPIVSEDIQAPSMKELAQLVEELHPYLNKQLRREYHRRVRPILTGILADVQSFLLDAANSVDAATNMIGLPLIVMPGSESKGLWPLRRKPKIMGADEAQEALLKGKWSYLVYSDIDISRFPIEDTWAGTLFDIVSRLPDPDRQPGKLLGKRQLTQILYTWCFTALNDFIPPIPTIERRDRSAEPGFAAVYSYWKTEGQKGARASNKQAWLIDEAESLGNANGENILKR